MFQQLENILTQNPMDKEFRFTRADVQNMAENFKNLMIQVNTLSRENSGLRGVLVKLGLDENGEETMEVAEFTDWMNARMNDAQKAHDGAFDSAEDHHRAKGALDTWLLMLAKWEEYEAPKFAGWAQNKAKVLAEILEVQTFNQEDDLDVQHKSTLEGQLAAVTECVEQFGRVRVTQ